MDGISTIRISVGITQHFDIQPNNKHEQQTENALHGYHMRDNRTRESCVSTGFGAAHRSCKGDINQTSVYHRFQQNIPDMERTKA